MSAVAKRTSFLNPRFLDKQNPPLHLLDPKKIDYDSFPKYAKISDCEKYRYELRRQLRECKDGEVYKYMVFVMLNPSTADSYINDATIRRCIWFGLREGCHDIYVVNLFAFRTPSPTILAVTHKKGLDVVGQENDAHIEKILSQKGEKIVVAAWGSPKNWKVGVSDNQIISRANKIFEKFGKGMVCFKTNQDGSPVHPLYQPSDTVLKPYKRQIQGELFSA